MIDQRLPVAEVLGALKASLQSNDQVVLQAPPGAGKTTLVPLALMGESWLGQGKILMLEPRRIATRAAAYRMAELYGEQVGQTVGYAMRLESRLSAATKIQVITEGVLTQMLMEDPTLSGVGLVIFDEFHERSLDADLALSLCLKSREIFREEPLKLLVMSATMDSDRVAAVIQAPIISSEGKQYPVELIYGRAAKIREKIADRIVETIRQAESENPNSSILVFLPGEGEIRQTLKKLSEAGFAHNANVEILPLFGSLSQQAQQYAIAPGHRKIVLATNIAETSLTIEGVDVVVDSGLVRVPAFDPSSGMTRLVTQRISSASSIQRAGRAGRLRPGKCYRLWSASQQQELAVHAKPEIANADLVPLVLQLLRWGIGEPNELTWIDSPPSGPLAQARQMLISLGAATGSVSGSSTGSFVLTDHGEQMSVLGVHPRLAHMLLMGWQFDRLQTATLIAAVLSDRDPFDNPDMTSRVSILIGQTRCPREQEGWKSRTLQLARQYESQVKKAATKQAMTKQAMAASVSAEQAVSFLLACAFPDRIARKRHSGGYQLANGRSATLPRGNQFTHDQWLAVAEVSGLSRSQGDVIRSGAVLDPELLEGPLQPLVQTKEVIEWSKKENRFVAEHRRVVGELVFSRRKLASVSREARVKALIDHLRGVGLEYLPWNKDLRNWQARVQLAGTHDATFPAISDDDLIANLEDWLAPFLDPVTKPEDFRKLALAQILHGLLTWEQQKALAQVVPETMTVPSGASIKLDYLQTPPVLGVKLQELFGMSDTPLLLNGKMAVVIHLLSPAGRPLQVTQDLAHFWRNTYQDVRKDMRGRYPKHPWPEDPLTAVATAKTKRALAGQKKKD
jgi:ATP-dependent helicase HrpB